MSCDRRSSYQRTKRVGEAGVKFLLSILSRAGLPATAREGLDERADVDSALAGSAFTLECKYDQMEATTGNLAVEFYNTRQGKPSGVAATESDLWVFVLDGEGGRTAFVTRSDRLRQFCDQVAPLAVKTNAGDGNAAVKLYNRDLLLLALFHRMDDLSADELRALLLGLLGEGSSCTTSK